MRQSGWPNSEGDRLEQRIATIASDLCSGEAEADEN
jgi:hypothetical protein